MLVLNEACKPIMTEGLDEEEKESKEYLFDNSISCAFKVFLFQNDGGNLVKPELLVQLILPAFPLVADLEEAVPVHELFLTQLLAKNPLLLAHPDTVKAAIMRIQEYSGAHTAEGEDILGSKGRTLLESVLGAM
jgi:hypothetical protein